MAQQPANAVTLKVRVNPKASRNRVDAYLDDALRLRVTASAQGGKANQAMVALLAEALGVAKSRLQIVRGHGSRDKVVVVESLSRQEIEQRLWASVERAAGAQNVWLDAI